LWVLLVAFWVGERERERVVELRLEGYVPLKWVFMIILRSILGEMRFVFLLCVHVFYPPNFKILRPSTKLYKFHYRDINRCDLYGYSCLMNMMMTVTVSNATTAMVLATTLTTMTTVMLTTNRIVTT
jgi:hypothetical protein